MMGYFPFFVELSGKDGPIVGGGVTALRKIQKLLLYGPRLTVAAPAITEEIRMIDGPLLLFRPFSSDLLAGKAFVIAATDNRQLNHRISTLCKSRHIPVNVGDDQAACTFLFPALVKQGTLSVGISTGGVSPSAAIYLKEQIAALLPDHFEELLTYLEVQRAFGKTVLPDQRRRSAFCAQLFIKCMQEGRADLFGAG